MSHLQFPLSFFLPDRSRGVGCRAVPLRSPDPHFLVDYEWRTEQCSFARCHDSTAQVAGRRCVFAAHALLCEVCRRGVASKLSHPRMVGAPKSKPEIAMHGGKERITLFVRSFAKTRPPLSRIKRAGPIILTGAVNYLTLPNSLCHLSAVRQATAVKYQG